MKRFLTGLSACLLMLTILLGGARSAGASTQDFTINSFRSDEYLSRTAEQVPTMKVDETIVAVFPEYDQNHGIERAIPTSYKNQPLDLKIASVTNDTGRPYSYKTRTSNGNLVLRIGDANSYVHGVMTYRISYTIRNPISFPGDHDELYWNVNGTGWSQHFNQVTANLHIPADLASSLQGRQVCYAGMAGSTTQTCTITRDKEAKETIVTAQAQNLPAGGNLTYVLAFNSGTFAIDKAAQRARLLTGLAIVGLAVGMPLLVLVLVIYKWRKYGRDTRGKGTIIPEYTPPKDLNALTSDVIMQEKVRNQAISALIIELAIRGVLAIHSTETKKLLGGTKTEYQIEMLKPADGLTPEEATVHSMLFNTLTVPEARTVNLKDVSKKAYISLQALTRSVPKGLFEKGYFVNDPQKITARYRLWAIVMFGAGVATLIWLSRLWTGWIGLGVGLIVSNFIVLFVASHMPARGPKGVETRDYLLGLKDFISVAEADRLKYLQSPEGVKQWGDPSKPETKIKLFEKLLPYAMIFGLEKDWAGQFADIYQQPPDWYQGNWNTFNTVYLVNSLNSFGTSAMASFAPPSSSGSSGFGGGGFSGGGGGGGGGGGW